MAAPLPPGWSLQTSKSTGKQYWFNSKTGESSYTLPAAVQQQHHHQPQPPQQQWQQPAPHAYTHAASVASASAAPHPSPAALAVASAYDSLTQKDRGERNASRILHLKNFNNWVKAVLIAEYAPRPCARVLDLACGKLGDLRKWELAGARTYCGVDISRGGIEDARGRFNASRGGRGTVAGRLVRADLGATDLSASRVLDAGEQFDAISIQFALHYLFQSEARALTFFRNIAGRLAPGGVLLGTIPDAAYLVRRLRDTMMGAGTRTSAGVECGDSRGSDATGAQLPGSAADSAGVTSDSGNGDSTGSVGEAGGSPSSLSFGNAIYNVEFTPDAARRQWALGSAPYGVKYRFFLAESVDNVDEYLVPWQLLSRLAASVGLVPLCADNFHAFYGRMIGSPAHRQTASAMSVMNGEGSVSAEEWEAARLYRVFAFQRPREGAAGEGAAADVAAATASLPSSSALMGCLAAAGESVYTAALSAPVPYKLKIGPDDVVDVMGASTINAI